MPFRALFTGVFTGTLAAIFVLSQGSSVLVALLCYSVFGALALVGMSLVMVVAPKRPEPSRAWRLEQARKARKAGLWHPISWTKAKRGPGWQDRLERMAKQTRQPENIFVFTSVRRARNSMEA